MKQLRTLFLSDGNIYTQESSSTPAIHRIARKNLKFIISKLSPHSLHSAEITSDVAEYNVFIGSSIHGFVVFPAQQ